MMNIGRFFLCIEVTSYNRERTAPPFDFFRKLGTENYNFPRVNDEYWVLLSLLMVCNERYNYVVKCLIKNIAYRIFDNNHSRKIGAVKKITFIYSIVSGDICLQHQTLAPLTYPKISRPTLQFRQPLKTHHKSLPHR